MAVIMALCCGWQSFPSGALYLRNDADFPEHLHVALAKQDYYFLPKIRFSHALKAWTNIAFPQFVSGQSISTKIRIFARKEKKKVQQYHLRGDSS